MNTRKSLRALGVFAALGAGGFGLYELGLEHGRLPGQSSGEARAETTSPSVAEDPSTWGIPQGEAATRRHIESGLSAGDIDPITGRRILYYHDPMVPGRQFDAPAKSPFMDMMLVPMYAGGQDADDGVITVSPRIQQNLGIRISEVVEASIAAEITTDGTIAWNERGQYVVQARAKGFVEKLHVRATLDEVRTGQALFDVYVPDWVAVQEDFLAVRRMRGPGLESLVEAARQRMRQAGMNDAQIALVERSGQVQARISLTAPADGVVTELMAREGSTVMPGMALARINDLSSVWAHAEVPESQASLLRVGSAISATTAARPGEVFTGRVQALLPQVDLTTRTIRARMEIDNPDGRLVPGLSVRMRLAAAETGPVLLVPTEALIHTGRRTLVIAADADRFHPLEVVTGMEYDNRTEILRGLQRGQRIVVSGQFLIDSEASLRGVKARLTTTDASAAESPREPTYRTRALVEENLGDLLTLTHPAIPALNWPEMTMDFVLAPEVEADGLRAGTEVEIEFRTQEGDLPIILGMQPRNPDATGSTQ